jgi:hypothetical protein
MGKDDFDTKSAVMSKAIKLLQLDGRFPQLRHHVYENLLPEQPKPYVFKLEALKDDTPILVALTASVLPEGWTHLDARQHDALKAADPVMYQWYLALSESLLGFSEISCLDRLVKIQLTQSSLQIFDEPIVLSELIAKGQSYFMLPPLQLTNRDLTVTATVWQEPEQLQYLFREWKEDEQGNILIGELVRGLRLDLSLLIGLKSYVV